MASEEAVEDPLDRYSPSYRQQDVDETLDDHEQRLSRLEVAAIFLLGYAAADAPDIVSQLTAFL